MADEFEIEASEVSVAFWTDVRLPFEPRSDLLTARERLREAVRGLEAIDGSFLAAEFTSTDEEFFDVENVLLYNVGTGVFAATAQRGLHAQRAHREPGPAPSGRTWRHCLRYSVEAPVEPPAGLLPHAEFPCPSLSTSSKPHEVWWALCEGRAWLPPSLDGPFRLDIAVPTNSKNLAALVKPLLDGVICTMHPASSLDEEAVSRLAGRTGWPELKVRHHLKSPPLPVLEPRRVLNRYRDFIKWNPADERCEEFTVWRVPTTETCRVWVRPMGGAI